MSSIHLTGDFTLDALSPRGTILYLLEYYQAGTSHYNVRAYDVRANRMLAGSIVDKSDLSEKMQGNALSRQMSAGGDMAYTLYVNPVLNRAFIHILWLTDTVDSSASSPTIARCIELPVGGSPALLRYYTLALSQDGQALYAANAALGTLATVNLKAGMNSYQLWLIPNARVAHFDPGKSVPTVADQARELYRGAARARSELAVCGGAAWSVGDRQ